MVINSQSSINSNSNIFTKIPRKIWQTYKTSKLPKQAKAAQKTWLSASQFDYLFFNDNDIECYILENWDSNTYDFFKALPLGVMKADLWRYLIICTEGRVYSDIDSILCKNLNS